MQILDAMRRSNTAEEICLLLTSYIETVQFYAAAERLPECVVALPVRGTDDVEKRYCQLRETRLRDLAPSHCDTHGQIVAETGEVLQEALTCLRAMALSARRPAPAEASAHA